MIDPKPLFQPLMPLETRLRFSRICHWERLLIALADLRGQGVPVIRIANEAFGTHYQSLLMRHGETDFNPKLVTDSRLAFADTFHFGRVQRV